MGGKRTGGGKEAGAAAATQRQELLALMQKRGRAHQALASFISLSSAAVNGYSSSSGTNSAATRASAGLALLKHAFSSRHPSWDNDTAAHRSPSSGRTIESAKHDALFAAKTAQNVIKTYASASKPDDEEADVVAAMDLSCMALYVVCALEQTVRLGDLVVDNMLYQVAKKYADIPMTRKSASLVAAYVHIRLWSAQTTLGEEIHEGESQFIVKLLRHDETVDSIVDTLQSQLELLAEFPSPKTFHTAQFTRLLLGHANTCVTLLVAAKKHQGILSVAQKTLSPWIAHLRRQDQKLAASFSDRTFRVLWKCASATDGDVQNMCTLQLRAEALSFLVKCPNYTSLYFIQQVYRVGVQHERASKRSPSGFQELYAFYARSANVLAEKYPDSTHLYASKQLQWEYIQWMEHFALACESLGHGLEGTRIMENAIQYVQPFGALGQPIHACLLIAIAGTLLDAARSAKPKARFPPQERIKNSVFEQRLQASANRMLHEPIRSSSSEKWSEHYEKTARVYLKKLEALAPLSFQTPDSQQHPALIPFLNRCLKKSTAKVFNYTINIQQSAKLQLYNQVISSFDGFCRALKELRSVSAPEDAKTMEILILNESRLHRMAVVLMARCCMNDSIGTAAPPFAMISRHVNLIRELLDDTMLDGKPSDSVLQGVLGDLNSIARECYSCATQCYKRKNFPETISALMGAFELAESYLEYVMCSNFTAEEIHNAHSQLQVDAIVSLLAYCFHELGDATKARTFTGYSILYCSDVNKKIPRASIDKYVASILEELRAHGETRETFIFSDFKRFVDSATHVFQARRVPKLHITGIWSAFRDSIERMSARILIGMRTKEPDALEDVETIGAPLEVSVRLCAALETFLADIVMKSKGQMTGDGSSHTALVEVCSALGNRKLIYSVYYASRDPQSAIDGLTRAYDTLSGAIEKLQHSASAVVDLGGVYGWRGVITMEITLISSYSNAHERMDSIGEDSINEENAIADIEQCLMHWGQHGNSPGILFDPTRVVCCLEAVCSSLSLISCPVLEKAARKLLKMFQSSADEHDVLPMVVPPLSLGLLDIHVDENAVGVEMGTVTLSGTALDGCGVLRQFELVDAEIGAAVASHFDDDTAQAYQHLLNAITVLHAVKGKTGKRFRNPVELKAAGMRELLMHLVLSDIHFSEGRSKFAIAEAKAALGICWKLSKKFASTPSASETGHFELPPEIASTRGNDCQLGNPSSLLYFKALECSSWDLLHAAKFSLCRLASLFSCSGQPHRAAMYFAEAMQLVGGLNLRFFYRSPFYEYAELQLNSSHLEQAKVAMGLLSSCQERGTPMTDDHINDDATPTHHSCFQSDSEFVEQNCNEIIQRGDVLLIDGDSQGALACYTHVIQALSTAKNAYSGHASSKILARAEARCWRKLMRLKSQTNDLTDTAAVEELLSVMKKLKRAMKSCESRLERVKCMLELGRVNIRLLRSSSSRAFLNLERTLALLEEAYWLGDHLGIPHLSQNLRTALGMAYFVEIEDSAQDETDRMDGGERSSFLSWASGSLLANASSADIFDDPFSAMEMEADSLVKETMTMQLERLAGAGSPAKLQHNPLQEMIGSITKRVGELPDSWLPVSLAIGLASELVVTRIPTDGTTPISFCLPNVGWAKCMREMETIIKESRVTLSGHSAEEASSWDAERKKGWWNSRKVLDERLGSTIASMQRAFGFWRCLLIKGTSTTHDQSVQRCWALLTRDKAGPITLAERNQTLLCAIADAQSWLSDEEVLEGLKHIAAEIEVPLSRPTAQEALQFLRGNDRGQGSCLPDAIDSNSTASTDALRELTTESIRKMKVGEVKQYLARAGFSTDGLKKALVERLVAVRDTALCNALKRKARRNAGQVDGGSSATDWSCSTILILNHQLHEFPWEGMDVMGGCRGVTRMPSLDLILENTRRNAAKSPGISSTTPCCIRRDRVHFLLNPAGDLKSTQKQLGPVLQSGETALGWEGIVGEVPEPDKLRNYLLHADLYIYCGHGSGEKYLHRDKILSLQSACSAALLFGCSSGRLEKEGIFGPSGAVLAYLRAGSPAVLAMLWDVTDKDIDQLSVKVLQKWLLADNEDQATDCSRSLAQVLQDSRQVCKLQYLNGHAAVCYGLPLHVSTS